MKHYLFLGLIILSALLLASCASNRNPNLHHDLTDEVWMRAVETSPNSWALGADSWFLTGNPTKAEEANLNAPDTAAISTMTVRVANFTNIRTSGDFQLEIFCAGSANSVYVFGPNDGVRQVGVGVRGNTLILTQVKNASNPVRRVIVRVGVGQLTNLVQVAGSGRIEGVHLASNGLNITTAPGARGNIYLAGNMVLRRIDNAGGGCINVFGVNTPGMDIVTSGGGSVNISGNSINLRTIKHNGGGNINVIGAQSDALQIFAGGSGKIGINGQSNLRTINAKGSVAVLVYPVTSTDINVSIGNKARVGLAGYSNNLIVNTTDSARFEGRYLCVHNAYVRAHDWAHINVATTNRIFASATQNASVYFFGVPNALSQFVSGAGVVIPIWSSTASSCSLAYQHASYNGENIPLPSPVVASRPPVTHRAPPVQKVKTFKVVRNDNIIDSPPPPPTSQYQGRKVKQMVRYQNF